MIPIFPSSALRSLFEVFAVHLYGMLSQCLTQPCTKQRIHFWCFSVDFTLQFPSLFGPIASLRIVP